MSPKISVIIPTFNRADLIGETVRSVLDQTLTEVEIIVVDDGSTDNTAEVIEQFRGLKNFRYLRQENQGRSVARNLGLENAVSPFLMFLDSDDLLIADGLETLYSAALKYPQSGVTAGTRKFVDSSREVIDVTDPVTHDRELLSKRVTVEKIRGLFICMGSFIIKRELALQLNGFNKQYEPAEDYDFFVRYCDEAPITYLLKPVVLIRQHGGNTPQDALREASIEIGKRNIRRIEEGGLSDHPDIIKRVTAAWYMRLGDDYYSLCRNRDALRSYLTSVKSDPAILATTYGRHIARQLLVSVLKIARLIPAVRKSK